jgi:hypothetical protein
MLALMLHHPHIKINQPFLYVIALCHTLTIRYALRQLIDN